MSRAEDDTLGDGDSFLVTVSADGRYVAFTSEATNLVTDDTNGFADIFVKDRMTGAVQRFGATDASTPTARGTV